MIKRSECLKGFGKHLIAVLKKLGVIDVLVTSDEISHIFLVLPLFILTSECQLSIALLITVGYCFVYNL